MQPPPGDLPAAPGPDPNQMPPNPGSQIPPPPPGYAPQGYPPPPGHYGYAPPPQKRFPWWAFVLGGCGCLALFVPIMAAILFPVFAQAREAARQASCLSNEKQQALAILMYTQDYDETMPLKTAWMDVLEPYSRSKSDDGSLPFPQFHCPSVSPADAAVFGYAYDSRLSARTMDKIRDPRSTMMTYDSTALAKNAADPGTSMPTGGRHRRRNNASFADGHAAAVTPAGSTEPGSNGE